MTSAMAIRNECRACQPGQRMTPEKCETRICKLSPGVSTCRSSVKRIAAHCRDCQVEDHPRDCTGRLLDGRTCPLHPYRLGKNPARAPLSAERKEKLLAASGNTRFRTVQKGRFPAPGSTISPGAES